MSEGNQQVTGLSNRERERREGQRCQTLTIDEVAARLGISRSLAYRLASSGGIPVVKLGKRLLVPEAALDRFLAV